MVDKVTHLIRTRTPAEHPDREGQGRQDLVISTDQAYAEQVLKGGNLGATESFKQAVPDTSGAVMVGYVDFAAIASLTEEQPRTRTSPLSARPVSPAASQSDGAGEFTLRVVAK